MLTKNENKKILFGTSAETKKKFHPEPIFFPLFTPKLFQQLNETKTIRNQSYKTFPHTPFY
jgi:hypothetical protein